MRQILFKATHEGKTAPALLGEGVDVAEARKDAKSKSRLSDFPCWEFVEYKDITPTNY